jgi:hypothetical protein
MKTLFQLLSATLFGSACLLGLAHAQTDANSAPPAGATAASGPATTAPAKDPDADAWLLGRTYIQVDGTLENFKTTNQHATGASPGVGLNLPLGEYFDYGLRYAYEHAANSAFHLNDNTVETGLTAYDKLGGFAPFVAADIGYAWDRSTNTSAPPHFDHALYEVDAGVEVPVSTVTSLRAWAEHDSSLRAPHQNDWSYNLGANAWFNQVIGTFVGVGWKSGYLGSHSAVAYTAGLRFSLDSP